LLPAKFGRVPAFRLPALTVRLIPVVWSFPELSQSLRDGASPQTMSAGARKHHDRAALHGLHEGELAEVPDLVE